MTKIKLNVFGLSFRTIDLNKIGKFHLETEVETKILLQLKEQFGLSELVYLATCNRLEFIFYSESLSAGDLFNFLKLIKPNETTAFYENSMKHFYYYQGDEALSHVFDVSASLKSAVVGEGQIITQIRKSFEKSFELKIASSRSRILLKHMVESAKEVHTKTEITRKPISIASVAMTLLKENTTLRDKNILMVGAGETNQIVAKYLMKESFKSIVIANRTVEKAEDLASDLNGKAISLNELQSSDFNSDIIIICTSSQKALLTDLDFKNRFTAKNISILDLSVPHNIESSDTDRIHVINVEDVKNYAQKNKESRKKEIDKASKIITHYRQKYKFNIKKRFLENRLVEVPQMVKTIHESELEKIFKTKLKHIADEDKKLVKEFVCHLSNKFIQIPMKMAKDIILNE
jgi:glutamyl-tRNA reductase